MREGGAGGVGGGGWGGGTKDLGQVVHDTGLLGVHQVEFPYENNEMCIESVQVSLEVQGHRLLKVGPVQMSQHVEQEPADLLYQRIK